MLDQIYNHPIIAIIVGVYILILAESIEIRIVQKPYRDKNND